MQYKIQDSFEIFFYNWLCTEKSQSLPEAFFLTDTITVKENNRGVESDNVITSVSIKFSHHFLHEVTFGYSSN